MSIGIRVGCLAIAAASLVLACTAAGSGSTAPLLIAVEGPQSGAQAANGVDQLRGVRLAVNQLNARGGLWDGRKVAVFAADDKADAANAKAVARQVIAKRIGFVIGPYNSSVGIANLPLYRRAKVLPLWMTSRDETAGVGATVQPMNTQIAPVEQRYVKGSGAKRVAMLVDDTPNGAFTKGMADRLRAALERDGASVTWTSVLEATDPGATGSYYADRVAEALKSNARPRLRQHLLPGRNPDRQGAHRVRKQPTLPDGARERRQRLRRQGHACGGAAVRLQRRAGGHRDAVRQDVRASVPRDVQQDAGVWGSFTYDSARILFAAIDRAKSYGFAAVERQLRATKGYRGATGTITIDPKTGYRTNVPVSILRVDNRKRFVIAR